MQIKSPDNSNTLNIFNNNTYTNFKTAYKHMLILWWRLDHKFQSLREGVNYESLAYEVIT